MGEITVILLLALIFLGPSKLPDLAAGLGKLIREIRKATSDVKNEIALDETFRKPFEDLRDAVTLHPDELKRRDKWAKEREEATKRALEEAEAAVKEVSALTAETAGGAPLPPPDGLADNVKLGETTLDEAKVDEAKVDEAKLGEAKLGEARPLDGAKISDANMNDVAKPSARVRPPTPVLSGRPHGPNDTVVQTAPPRGATLDDVPTPPPESTTAGKPPAPPQMAAETALKPASPFKPAPPVKPAAAAPGLPPAGTVARPGPDALRGVKPAARRPGTVPATPAPPTTAPSKNGESAVNTTQILREEDLIPSPSSGTPPPPPHLPGLRPAGAPRPTTTPTPPLPTAPTDKKKP